MILYPALALGTVLACEIAWRLRSEKSLTTLSRTALRSLNVLRSPAISDGWKEKVLPAYAARMMKASLSLFGCLVLIIAPLIVIAALAAGSLTGGGAVLMRPLVLGLMIAVGAGYVLLRRRVAG